VRTAARRIERRCEQEDPGPDFGSKKRCSTVRDCRLCRSRYASERRHETQFDRVLLCGVTPPPEAHTGALSPKCTHISASAISLQRLVFFLTTLSSPAHPLWRRRGFKRSTAFQLWLYDRYSKYCFAAWHLQQCMGESVRANAWRSRVE